MGANNVVETIMAYLNNSQLWIVFLIALFYIWRSSIQDIRRKLSLTVLLAIVLVFNNWARGLIGKFTDVATYYRFLWCIPITIVISIMLVKLFYNETQWRYRIIGVIVLIVCLQLIPTGYFQLSGFTPQENEYHLSSETISLCDAIEEDKTEENPVVVFDTLTQLEARQYDPALRWGISRDAYLYINNVGYDQGTGAYVLEERLIKLLNNGITCSSEELKESLEALQIDYLVAKGFEGDIEYMEQVGCEYVAGTDTHRVYHYKYK